MHAPYCVQITSISSLTKGVRSVDDSRIPNRFGSEVDIIACAGLIMVYNLQSLALFVSSTAVVTRLGIYLISHALSY